MCIRVCFLSRKAFLQSFRKWFLHRQIHVKSFQTSLKKQLVANPIDTKDIHIYFTFIAEITF